MLLKTCGNEAGLQFESYIDYIGTFDCLLRRVKQNPLWQVEITVRSSWVVAKLTTSRLVLQPTNRIGSVDERETEESAVKEHIAIHQRKTEE